jgi:hypothetical protein
MHGKDREAVIEIFPKLPGLYTGSEGAVRRGHEPHVHFDFPCASEPTETPRFENLEQLRL